MPPTWQRFGDLESILYHRPPAAYCTARVAPLEDGPGYLWNTIAPNGQQTSEGWERNREDAKRAARRSCGVILRASGGGTPPPPRRTRRR